MKLIFALFFIFWGFQLLIESLFGLYIPFLKFLFPVGIILFGLYLIQKPDWDFSCFSFTHSKLILTNTKKSFLIEQLKHKSFIIKYSDCIFDGSTNNKNTDTKLWIDAKKSHINIVCNKNTHTVIYLSSARTAVYYSNVANKDSSQNDFDTIHIGNINEKCTVFYHIQAKDCIIEISEK